MSGERTHRPSDPTAGSWALSGALWLALVGAVSGVGRLLVGVEWLLTFAIAAAVVLASTALMRTWRAHPVLPPLVGALVTASAITALYLPTNALLLLVPTPASIAEAGLVAESGFSSIATQGLPAVADTGIAFLLVGGSLLLTWLADLFAFTVRVPASTGVLLLALLAVPAIIDPSDVSWASLVITSVGFAGILAAAAAFRAPSRTGQRRAVLPALAVVAVVVTVSATFAGAAPGYFRAPLSSGASGTLFNGSIDPVVALGDDLRRPNAVTVLEYATSIETPVYLRVLGISDFDGENWAPSDASEGDRVGLDQIPAPSGLSEEIVRTVEPVEVSISTLRSQWLPVPSPLVSVDGISPAWRQAVEDGSVSGRGTTRSGDDYTADALVLAPSDEQLDASGPVGGGFDRYLALPEDVPDIVGQTANDVTADAGTPYDRARALQAYFRSSAFIYSEDTPAEEGYDGDGVGVLADFLETKAGYCVHFASAMAVMARQLGIPSRLAIGYQPGTSLPGAGSDLPRFRVSSSDLHAWPELYFEGVGWLPFEPTPSRGAPAAYTLPSATTSGGSTSPTGEQTTAPEETTAPAASATPTATTTSAATAGSAASGGGPVPAGAFWFLVVVVLLLIPSFFLAVQRSVRRRRSTDGSSEAVWSEVLAVARDLGIPIDDGDSPRVIESDLAAAMQRGGTSAPLAELAALRASLERRRFAAAAGDGFAWERAAALIRALRDSAPVPARVLAAIVPRSFVGSAVRRRSAEL